jgi:hypothetical protein
MWLETPHIENMGQLLSNMAEFFQKLLARKCPIVISDNDEKVIEGKRHKPQRRSAAKRVCRAEVSVRDCQDFDLEFLSDDVWVAAQNLQVGSPLTRQRAFTRAVCSELDRQHPGWATGKYKFSKELVATILAAKIKWLPECSDSHNQPAKWTADTRNFKTMLATAPKKAPQPATCTASSSPSSNLGL